MTGFKEIAEDVADWINDELTEIGRQRVELRKRVEDDKKREFAKLDEELAKFDRGRSFELPQPFP